MKRETDPQEAPMLKAGDRVTLDGSTLNVTTARETSDAVEHLSVVVRTTLRVDRDQVAAWGLKLRSERLADRLAAGVLAGRVLVNGVVRVDVNGRTFVSPEIRVLGRTLNADLRRMGF